MNVSWNNRLSKPVAVHSPRAFALLIASTFVLTTSTAAPLGAESSHRHLSTPTALYGVGIARCTFVDHSRSALNYSTTPYRIIPGGRRLVTEVRYPIQRQPDQPAEIGRSSSVPANRWISDGRLRPRLRRDARQRTPRCWTRGCERDSSSVAPFFPDESASEVASQRGANTEGDLPQMKPGTSPLSPGPCSRPRPTRPPAVPIVSGLVEPSEIALAGHSDGAEVVGMLAYDHGDDPQGVKLRETCARNRLPGGDHPVGG